VVSMLCTKCVQLGKEADLMLQFFASLPRVHYLLSHPLAAVSVGDCVSLYAMKNHAVMVDFFAAKVRWFSDGHTCDTSCKHMYGFNIVNWE